LIVTEALSGPFEPPPYPYDRLNRLKPVCEAFDGGLVDLSIGTPFDAPPESVIKALAGSGTERSYPASAGTPEYRRACTDWMRRRFGVDVPIDQVAAAVGTKEFVASLPGLLKLMTPTRDTVLYPAISYPSYAMGATLGGCRSVGVPFAADGTLDLAAVDQDDIDRALLLWVNSPGNPTGQLDDLASAATWGRAHGIPVFSDECYIEFTWDGAPQTILEHGLDGVIAVHSLSKRSNLAGARVGFYAGDRAIVEFLRSVRQHSGMMVPGPMQAAGAVAFDDDEHVEVQRERYRHRLEKLATVLSDWSGIDVPLPGGAFYLWIPVADGWAFAERLAAEGGALVSPGEFYGPDGSDFVRVAVVQPDDRIELVARRLSSARKEHSRTT
jgi:succinyldiaminopimelate transaminase